MASGERTLVYSSENLTRLRSWSRGLGLETRVSRMTRPRTASLKSHGHTKASTDAAEIPASRRQ